MSEDSASIRRILDACRRGDWEHSDTAIQNLIETLASVKSELQLVDKTSRRKEMLQWYLNTVKDILEDYATTKLLKSILASIKGVEKMSQDVNSLSWLSALVPEELDLAHIISHPSGSIKDKKIVAIVLKDVEKFVGEDGKEYGPYPTGSLINIPYYIARLLEGKRAVEEIFIT
jgi:hypothetical protein